MWLFYVLPPDKITDGNLSFKNTIRGCVVKFEVTAPQKMSFFEVFNEFLDKHLDWAPLSGHYKVLARLLRRFELYRQKTTRTKFTLILNDFDSTEIERFKDFVINEPKIYYKYPSIYKAAKLPENTAALRNAARTPLSVFLKGSGLSSTGVSNEAIDRKSVV